MWQKKGIFFFGERRRLTPSAASCKAVTAEVDVPALVVSLTCRTGLDTMDRARKAVPVANYVTYDRHRQTQHKKHRRKVTAVKASVDASVPFSHANRRPNVKREQILEERYYEIERDNRHLLKKINDMHNVSVLKNFSCFDEEPRSSSVPPLISYSFDRSDCCYTGTARVPS